MLSANALVADTVLMLGVEGHVRVEGPRAITTDQGEHAQLVSVHAGERACHRGIVIADDSYSCFAGTGSESSELQASIEGLVRSHSLGHGHDRLRWYRYARPRGWRPLVRVDETRWCSPEYERDRAMITVNKARPVGRDLGVRIYERLVEIQDDELVDRSDYRSGVPLETRTGLRGLMLGFRGRRPGGPWLRYVRAVVEDGRFAYPTCFEAIETWATARVGEYDRLLQSIESVPRHATAALDAFATMLE